MDKAGALAILNAKLLAAYSAHTVDALRGKLALRFALPYLEPVLALNVEKEARKDRIVIRHAHEAALHGRPPSREAAHELFVATKTIDADFLQRVDDFPVRVVIRYEEIEPLRTARIRYMLDTAYRMLSAWRHRVPFRTALRESHDQADFELVMNMIFNLYARETRALSRSVTLPAMLAPVGERAAQYIGTIMAETGMRLARQLARGAYSVRSAPVQQRHALHRMRP
jgi:hypothetical protein